MALISLFYHMKSALLFIAVSLTGKLHENRPGLFKDVHGNKFHDDNMNLK